MAGIRRVLVCLHHSLHYSCGVGCHSHTSDDQRAAHSGYPKEVVYTNTGAQVDSENAPRVLYFAGMLTDTMLWTIQKRRGKKI